MSLLLGLPYTKTTRNPRNFLRALFLCLYGPISFLHSLQLNVAAGASRSDCNLCLHSPSVLCQNQLTIKRCVHSTYVVHLRAAIKSVAYNALSFMRRLRYAHYNCAAAVADDCAEYWSWPRAVRPRRSRSGWAGLGDGYQFVWQFLSIRVWTSLNGPPPPPHRGRPRMLRDS